MPSTSLAGARPQATSRSVGDQHAHKPLARFGSASVKRPVSEGIARANMDDGEMRK